MVTRPCSAESGWCWHGHCPSGGITTGVFAERGGGARMEQVGLKSSLHSQGPKDQAPLGTTVRVLNTERWTMDVSFSSSASGEGGGCGGPGAMCSFTAMSAPDKGPLRVPGQHVCASSTSDTGSRCPVMDTAPAVSPAVSQSPQGESRLTLVQLCWAPWREDSQHPQDTLI